MNIVETIQDWDGRSTESVELFFDEFEGDARFVSTCLECLENDRLQSGASWLLKKYVENNGELGSGHIDEICGSLLKLKGWAPKLHILQTLPHLRIGIVHKNVMEQFVRECSGDKNKMVRAWALNGFFVLANQFPEYRKEASVLFETAIEDESAAVRARARNIKKTAEFL